MKVDIKLRLAAIEEEKMRIILKLKKYQFANPIKTFDKLKHLQNSSEEFKQKI